MGENRKPATTRVCWITHSMVLSPYVATIQYRQILSYFLMYNVPLGKNVYQVSFDKLLILNLLKSLTCESLKTFEFGTYTTSIYFCKKYLLTKITVIVCVENTFIQWNKSGSNSVPLFALLDKVKITLIQLPLEAHKIFER